MISTFTSNSFVCVCVCCPISENRRHVNYIFVLVCIFVFSIYIGLVDAAVDAAPGSGVFIQLHGQSLGGKFTTPKIG